MNLSEFSEEQRQGAARWLAIRLNILCGLYQTRDDSGEVETTEPAFVLFLRDMNWAMKAVGKAFRYYKLEISRYAYGEHRSVYLHAKSELPITVSYVMETDLPAAIVLCVALELGWKKGMGWEGL